MHRHIARIASLILFLSTVPAIAQQPAAYQDPDLMSYRHYLLSQWDSVAYYGNRALNRNIDHYYMRMRLGIAYYFKNNFLTAAYHFEKALDFEPASMDAKKYLYNCYMFSNRINRAESILRQLNEKELESFSHVSPSWIQSVNISAGNKFSDRKNIKGNQGYISAGASHGLADNIQWIHQYTYLKQALTNNASITQHQYYAATPFCIHERITIMPAVHFLVLSDGFTSSSLRAGHFEINYYYKKLSLSFSGSWLGSLKNGSRQAGAKLFFYPFGNLNLYHRFAAFIHEDPGAGTGSSLVLNVMTGLKITPRLWVEAEGTTGDRTNYMESSASVIHNTPDMMKEKWSLTTMILTGDNQTAYIKIIREHKKELQTGQSFYHNAIYGGYQWSFLKSN